MCTLLCRSVTVVLELEGVEEEVKHVIEDNKIDGPTANKHPVCIPYISGLSDQLERVFRSHSIPSYHKPFKTLRSLLVNAKDKSKREKQCGVVYSAKCSECDKEYIDETATMLGLRF